MNALETSIGEAFRTFGHDRSLPDHLARRKSDGFQNDLHADGPREAPDRYRFVDFCGRLWSGRDSKIWHVTRKSCEFLSRQSHQCPLLCPLIREFG